MKIIYPTLTIALLGAVFVCLFTMTARAEIAECLKWQQQAEEYPNFFLADWQQAQCDHHDIRVFLDQ